MIKLLAIIVLLVVPVDVTARDQCASFTRHFFYDDCGKPVFTQIVAWEESGRCFFWRMSKPESPLNPVREDGQWVLRWDDGGIIREVYAPSYDDDLHSQRDIEVCDREILPKEMRRPLTTRGR